MISCHFRILSHHFSFPSYHTLVRTSIQCWHFSFCILGGQRCCQIHIKRVDHPTHILLWGNEVLKNSTSKIKVCSASCLDEKPFGAEVPLTHPWCREWRLLVFRCAITHISLVNNLIAGKIAKGILQFYTQTSIHGIYFTICMCVDVFACKDFANWAKLQEHNILTSRNFSHYTVGAPQITELFWML